MTLIRGLATGISSRVVRWSSPGCKDWAEGLEREASVIESDWAAVRWSIGSMRVLLDRRQLPLTSLGEVPAETQKFVDKVRMRAGFVLAMSIMYGLQALLCLWKFCKTRNTLEFAACVIVVLGSILAGLYSLMERRRLNVPWYDDIYDDPVACAHLYKERLKRRDSLWIYTSYFLCAGLGMVINYGGSYDSEDRIYSAIFVGLFLLVIPPLILQVRRNNLRRIEEIDALLAERG